MVKEQKRQLSKRKSGKEQAKLDADWCFAGNKETKN